MSDSSIRLSRFWEELKRRKVFRVIAMYAATAFIIIEAGDIVLPRLGLPDWTVTFIIVLLIVGFPITIILSWIFDITPEGLKKTGPVQAASVEESTRPSAQRRFKPSDAIIAVLIVIVVVLAYPKVFKQDKFEGIRDQDGRISIAVMPFGNLTGDTLYNVWQGGFQNLLITALSNSEELLVRQYQSIFNLMEGKIEISYASLTPSLAREFALKLETRTFIIGNIMKAGKKIRVSAQLLDAETEEIYKTYQMEGNSEDDIFPLADSLSGLIKNYLEIRKLVEQYDSPDIRESFTHSSEALQCYFRGYNAAMVMDLQPAVEWFTKAIEIDSGFISAYLLLSITYRGLGEDKLARNCCVMANKNKHILPLQEQLQLDHLNAYYFGTPNEQIGYLKQILEIDELNCFYWFLLGSVYYNQDQYENAVIYFEKILDINRNWGTLYRVSLLYSRLGYSYHRLNNHKRENEVYEMGLTAFPDYPIILRYQAACALSQGEQKIADDLIARYISSRKTNSLWPESRILSGLGYTYKRAGLLNEAERFFRQAYTLDSLNHNRMHDLAWFLIDNDINVNEGIKLVENALALDPYDYYYLDTRGWGLYKQGRYEEALQVLNDSWDLRSAYDHMVQQHIQEVKKILATQNHK